MVSIPKKRGIVMKKLFVVDGNSIINRAYYGIRPLTTKDGIHTNAVYGMITMLEKQLDAVKPDI
jgi:DNA polymerase-1